LSPAEEAAFGPGARDPGHRARGFIEGRLFFLLSLAGHIVIIVPLAVWAYRQPPLARFELAPGSPFLAVNLVDSVLLGGDAQEAAEPHYFEAENPAVEDDLPEIEETPLWPQAEPEPPQPLDLKPPGPEEAPLPRPEAEAPQPRNSAKAPGAKKTPGPGPEAGSPHGQTASGGGGAGGVGILDAAGWQAVQVPQPLYPPASRENGEQGRVMVAVIVSPAGWITSVSIIRSSGYPALDQAALNAARHISFRAKSGGSPQTAVTVQVPYRFRLI
jgi:protein TonB